MLSRLWGCFQFRAGVALPMSRCSARSFHGWAFGDRLESGATREERTQGQPGSLKSGSAGGVPSPNSTRHVGDLTPALRKADQGFRAAE